MKKIIIAFLASAYCVTSLYAVQQNNQKRDRTKYLHIGFHKGCILELEHVAQDLNLDLTSWFIFDRPLEHFEGQNSGLYVYNMTAERAQRVWEKHKDYFNQFDVIITSDIAPLSRIFLQNGQWKKPLIIWVCNRFDWFYSPTHKPIDFPDEAYYELFQKATESEQVTVIPYSMYDRYHALKKGIDLGLPVIKPVGVVEKKERYQDQKWNVPADVDKKHTIFVYPRLGQRQLDYITEHCNQHGIATYSGRYNGTADIADFKGILYWPYQWSNLCLFEDFHLGLVHFVPSKLCLENMKKEGAPLHSTMMQLLDNDTFELNEWYCKDHRDLIVYYDSWEDLKYKIETTDYDAMSKKIRAFAKNHKATMMERWKRVFGIE